MPNNLLRLLGTITFYVQHSRPVSITQWIVIVIVVIIDTMARAHGAPRRARMELEWPTDRRSSRLLLAGGLGVIGPICRTICRRTEFADD